jgi:hypothetical protein
MSRTMNKAYNFSAGAFVCIFDGTMLADSAEPTAIADTFVVGEIGAHGVRVQLASQTHAGDWVLLDEVSMRMEVELDEERALSEVDSVYLGDGAGAVV